MGIIIIILIFFLIYYYHYYLEFCFTTRSGSFPREAQQRGRHSEVIPNKGKLG